MTLRVGIMGAGRMAQGFDAPGAPHVLSLAHAVCKSADLELGGFYDRDPARSAAAEQKWHCRETPRDRDAWLAQDWDLIFVATPDENHARDAHDAIARRPKGVLVEKPLARDPDAADDLLRLARERGIPILVDYPRRLHSAIAEVARLIGAGELGAPLAATFVYSGDAEHAATHMIDLFQLWWGNWSVAGAANIAGGHMIELQDDTRRMNATFVPLPADAHYVWELTVYCAQARIRLAESPEYLDVSTPGPHPAYSGFDVLQTRARYAMEEEPLLERTMERLVHLTRSPDAAGQQLAHECASQKLCGAILRAINMPGTRPEGAPG
jgi:hypothetical protein